ncbi:hypothetical protein TNCV_3892501 [Trichonephila clavipes]|nr:hypothetical protein TNCV_3892501 [Trichonephila clavipes]
MTSMGKQANPMELSSRRRSQRMTACDWMDASSERQNRSTHASGRRIETTFETFANNNKRQHLDDGLRWRVVGTLEESQF